jgi:dipeptidyl aminopeptidase/acylaminoacyl peptidase
MTSRVDLISSLSHHLKLADSYHNTAGRYYQRSPVMHAHKVSTATLNICGGLDRCTPSEEARQFHSALVENGLESILVAYPEEGHGVRKLPASVDYAVV